MPDGFPADSEVAGHWLAGACVYFQEPSSLLLGSPSGRSWSELVRAHERPHDLED